MLKESRYNIWVERVGAAYVYNGVSGGLRVPSEHRRAVQQFLAGESEACPPKVVEQMVLGQMLVPDSGDELEFLARRYAGSRYNAARFALTLVTSLGCNFDCPYCFEAKHPSIMDEEVQDAVLTVLDDQLPKITTFEVTWFGGEPLVGKKPLLALSDAFIDRCDRAGVEYSATITTNGYLLDEQTCIQLRDRRVVHAQIGIDGPPAVHDRMRPLAGGKGSFWGIIEKLHHAVKYLNVSVRVNVDTQNFNNVEELMQILVAEGFAGKLTMSPGQLVGITENLLAPSASYKPPCFTNPAFARAEREFIALAARYDLAGGPYLPQPTGAPCTAVRANELVVGSKGELYKCWDNVGDQREVIGNIRDYQNANGRLQKWLKYDPFSNDECRSCIALPVCMGGCASHAMDAARYENRCGTFRHTYREQVLSFVEAAEQRGPLDLVPAVQLTRPMETR
jgi:uncharacterized protein